MYWQLSDYWRLIFEYVCVCVCVCVREKGGIPWWPGGKESTCQAGDVGLIPGSGQTPGGEHGSPLQCSCLKKSMNRGAWRAAV